MPEGAEMNLLLRESFDTDQDHSLYNKVAWRILPFLFVLYVIAFLDRVNVGFAKLSMAESIGLSDAAFGLGAGIFFLAYSACEIPSNILLQRFGAKIWIARIMIVWGMISAGFMFINSPGSFYIMRFLLGVAEAGFYPGMVLYMTYWFPSRTRSQAMAYFNLAIAMAGVLGSPLSGWIMQNFHNLGGLEDWQWLFLLEGLPATFLGIVVLFYLDDGPQKAKWLTTQERQRIHALLEHEREQQRLQGARHDFKAAFTNSSIWCLVAANFALLCGTYGVSFWLPQIVSDLGVSNRFHTGLIAAIPFAIASVVMIVYSRHSDRTGERRWHGALAAAASALGLVIAAAFHSNPWLSLGGLALAMSGALSGFCVLWAVPGTLLNGAAAAAGIALMATVGNLGGYLSPFMIGWVKQSTGHLEYGLFILAGLTFLGAISLFLVPKLREQGGALPGRATASR
jgi:D-galactonate transporter